jgi:hypothetical protein
MELKNLFNKGKMNKDLDERLVPNGEYTDALNIRVGKSSGSDVGAIENEKGNTQLSAIPSSDNPVCIGSVADEANEKIYWFVYDDNPSSYIYEYDARNDVTTTVLADTRNGVQQVLNFDINYKITHANVLYNKETKRTVLYFTDNLNPPRMVDVTRAKGYGLNNFSEEDINLYKKPPRKAPLITPFTTQVEEENNVRERHFAFAYRYKYLDGQFSALSSFSDYQFYPSLFNLDFETYENLGMINEFNSYNIEYNTGDKRVTDIQLCFKTPLSPTVFVIDSINKQENSLFDNVERSFVFTNKRVYKALPDDELNRLYDNVPLKALAQDVINDRLVFGNYTTQYDLLENATDRNNISIDYSAQLVSTSFEGDVETYTRVNSNKDIELDFTGIDFFKGYRITIAMHIKSAIVNQSGYYGGSFKGNNSVVLTQNYVDATAFYNSVDFTQMLLAMDANFQNNVSFTSPANTITPITYGTFTKVSSTSTSITLRAPQNTHSVDNTPGDNTDNDFTDFTEDYTWEEDTRFLVRKSASSLSLKSNRNHDFGIVYLDSYGRYSTVLPNSGDDGTDASSIFIPVQNSADINKAEITIRHKPPYWADRYKFFTKTDKDIHYNVYATNWYQDGAYAWIELNGNNSDKVEAGMNLLVKQDAEGALSNEVKVKVLEVTTKAGNDVVESDEGWIVGNLDAGGNKIKEIQGRYMKIRPKGFSLNQGLYTFFQYSGINTLLLAGNVDVTLPTEEEQGINQIVDSNTVTEFDLSAGSRVYLKFQSWDSPDRTGAESRYLEQEYIVQNDYTDSGSNVNGVFERFLSAETNWSKGNNSYYTDGTDQFRLTFSYTILGRCTINIESTETTTLTERGRIDARISIQRSSGVVVFETDPSEVDSDIYYETSEVFDIENGFHIGNTQTQTASQDAVVTLQYGNCYSFGNGVESISVKDERFGSTLKPDLRPNLTLINGYKEISDTNGLIYSGLANENTGYNSLNEFNASRGNTKFMDMKYGSIQRIFSRENDLLVIQEDQVSKVLYGKNILQSPDGSGSLTQIESILGQDIPYAGQYGISKNPESFSHDNGRVYFTDAVRGAVLRLGRDGITDISKTGMEGYFRDNLPLHTNKLNLGGFDPRYGEYVLSYNSSEKPVDSVAIDTSSEVNSNVTPSDAFVYKVNVGTLPTTITFNYLVSTAMTATVVYAGTTETHSVSANGNFTLSVTSAKLNVSNEATVTFSSTTNGNVNVSHSVPAEASREIITIVMNDIDDAGKTIQNRFYKANNQITDVNYYNKTDVFSNTGISRNETIVGVESNVYIPSSGDIVHLSSRQLLGINDGYFNSCNRIGYLLSDQVLTPANVQSNATYVSETILVNAIEREVTGSFTFSPTSSSQKLYIIYDYQDGSCTPNDEAQPIGDGGAQNNPG